MIKLRGGLANKFLELVFLMFIFSLPLLNESGFLTFELGFTVYPSYVLALLAMTLFIWTKFKDKDCKIIKSHVDFWVFAFLAVIALSIIQSKLIPLNSITPMSSKVSIFSRFPYLRSISQVASIFFMVLIYYLVINIIRTRDILKKVLGVLILSTTLVCILSLLAAVAHNFIKIPFLPSLLLLAEVSGNRGLRLQGFTPEPLIFATYLAKVIPITISACYSKWFPRIAMKIAVLIQIATLILTSSRSGYIAFSFTVFVMALYNFRNIVFFIKQHKVRIIIASTCFCLIAIILYKSNPEIINKQKNSSFIKRIEIEILGPIETLYNLKTSPYGAAYNETSLISSMQWGTLMRVNDIIAGFRMFTDHPVLGVGWGNYIFQYLKYDPQIIGWWWIERPDTQNRPGTPVSCNLFISIAAESGIIGISIFLILITRIFILSCKKVRILADPDLRLILIGLICSFVSGLICYQFFSTLYYPFFWVLLSILIIIGKNIKETGFSQHKLI